MALALRAALRGVGRTCPNPAVGAVVVKDGRVVSTGHHAACGAPHAEIVALQRAGNRARGASLYVTLEPCCHAGRTPPCTEAILEAGIAEVVFATSDPSPHCAGGGEAALGRGGVKVTSGVCAREAEALNAPFLKRLRRGLPLVTAKWAMTLDGKTASRTGDARWITSAPARALAHRLRSRTQAVLVGVGTVLADDPLLTVRLPGRRQAARIVADAEARLPLRSRLVQTAGEVPVLLAHGPGADRERLDALQKRGVRTIECPPRREGVDLEFLFRFLAAENEDDADVVNHVLLEGGGTLAASAMEAGLVDRVAVFIAPKILGGVEAKTPVGGGGAEKIFEALGVKETKTRRMGPDWLIEGVLETGGGGGRVDSDEGA